MTMPIVPIPPSLANATIPAGGDNDDMTVPVQEPIVTPAPEPEISEREMLNAIAQEMYGNDPVAMARYEVGLPPLPTDGELSNDGPAVGEGEAAPTGTGDEAGGEGGEGGGTGAPEGGDQTGATTSTTATTDTFTYDDGLVISREEARRYAEFDAWYAQQVEANGGQPPDLTAPLQQQQQQQQVVEPPQLTPPEGFDIEDPAMAAVWQQFVALHEQNTALAARLEDHDARFRHQSDTTTTSFINRARESFRQQHNLDPATMDRLHTVASSVINLDGFLDSVDPFDGKPQAPNPMAALERAYDVAYWAMPETREMARTELQEEMARDAKRQKKASALSSGGASAPRTAAVPVDPAARQSAFVREIGEQFFGTPQS